MNIIDYELIEDITILFESKIILYGAGMWAERIFDCLSEIGIYPEFVCQTEASEKKFHNREIKSLLDILSKYDSDNYLLIVASRDYYNEMIQLCSHTKKIKICTIYGFCISIKLQFNKCIASENFKNKIEAGIMVGQYIFLQNLKVYAADQFVSAALAPEEYIWIYQPGKVGSQSIWNSIRDRSLQFHSLMTIYRFTDVDKKYLDYYMQIIHEKKIKIISGVREPISHDIAAFFQNSDSEIWKHNYFNSNIFWLYGDIDNKKMDLNPEEMKKRCPQWRESLNKSFEDLADVILQYRLDLFSWFDYEIKRVFGVDIYSYPFDKEKGYSIIKKNNLEILLYKMECLSNLENVIGEFIGDKDYELVNRNRASEKIYAYAYQKFRLGVRIPQKYFDFYYNGNSKYEHFYTKKEIEAGRRMWEEFLDKN